MIGVVKNAHATVLCFAMHACPAWSIFLPPINSTGEGAICHSFVTKFFEEHYVVATPAETICENAALKEALYGDKVPLTVKQAIFRRPTLDPWTGEKDTRFDWDVPGIGHDQHSNAQATVEKVLREKKRRKR